MSAAPTTIADPSAVLGLLLYNHAETLPETLDSLRNQERGDFIALLVDDQSDDGTAELCAAVAARDPRFVHLRDGTRRGYIENARYALAEARRRFPDAPYFTWGSDHDLYHPRWLDQLIAALEAEPTAALAWPLCQRIDADGRILERVVHRFDTVGVADPVDRFRRTLRANLTGETVVGNMIYGLFRRDVFNGGPGLQRVLLPDRVAILEAALAGSCVQVDEALWYRRYEGIASPERQRRASFFNGAPWYLGLPIWITHAGHFLINWGLRGQGRPQVSRSQGLTAAFAFAFGYPRWHITHRLRMRGPQWRRKVDYAMVKPVRMALHRSGKRLRADAREVWRRIGAV